MRCKGVFKTRQILLVMVNALRPICPGHQGRAFDVPRLQGALKMPCLKYGSLLMICSVFVLFSLSWRATLTAEPQGRVTKPTCGKSSWVWRHFRLPDGETKAVCTVVQPSTGAACGAQIVAEMHLT